MLVIRALWRLIAGSSAIRMLLGGLAALGVFTAVLRRDRKRTVKIDRLENYHDTRKAADKAPVYTDADRARDALSKRLSRIRDK